MEDLLTEVRIMKKVGLGAYNICEVYGACILNDYTILIVMEFFSSGDLTKYLQSTPSLSLKSRVYLCLNAANAVAFLHFQLPPILHRDIKSSNFLVHNGSIYLTDFGISKEKQMVGSSIGTLNWTAPEILNREGKWTEKSDVYSLGLVFYEILSCKMPFEEVDPGEVAFRIIAGERPPIPPTCPEVIPPPPPPYIFDVCYLLY